ncbi:MAG TPA: ABC transporter permease [Gemmatimonadaceae bacterium]|nr:ABC transporter permease [Gemmatimonadaceae bacterium]
MRSVAALIRAGLLTASSYRLGMVFSVLGLFASFVPLYFISGAIQPVVEESIRLEGGQYFGFLIVGIGATFMLTSAVSSVPASLAGSISSGTFEALLVTRTSAYQLLLGLSGYGVAWSALRALLLVAGASMVGVQVAWTALPAVAAVIAIMTAAYFALGLIAGAFVLVFRTSGPLTTAIITASGLLGGVYYSTSVIPSWLNDLSALVPLTYALRASRMLLLGGADASAVTSDVVTLAVFTLALLVASMTAFTLALRYARRAGTLSQY